MFPVDFQVAIKLYGQKIGAQISGDILGEAFRGYTLRITGGDDTRGLPMKGGVLTDKKVRLLLKKGSTGYRCREKGVRMRKAVRGCIISNEIVVVSMVILKEGDKPIEGVTDRVVECSHLPKRATKLRKMFGIPKEANIVEFIRDMIKKNAGSEKVKYPRIRVTRLVTPLRLRRKKNRLVEKEARKEKSDKAQKEYMDKYFPGKTTA